MPAKLPEYVHVPPKRRPALDAPVQDLLLMWRMRNPRRHSIRDKTPPPVPGSHPQAAAPADPGTAQTHAPPNSVWIYVPKSARNDPHARTPVPRDSGRDNENIPHQAISLAEECCQRASRMDVFPEGPSPECNAVSQTRESVRSGGCNSVEPPMRAQVPPTVVPDEAAANSRKYALASWIPCRAPSTPDDSLMSPVEAQVPPAVVPDEAAANSKKYELASWIPCRAPSTPDDSLMSPVEAKYALASWIPCRAPSTPDDSLMSPVEAQVPPAVVPDEAAANSRKYALASWIPCCAPSTPGGSNY
ncbi:hypothetical protein QR680_016256 [Steinernema hermaphroditum]|uniref:Uncharacterized protein n=1 Tax=Steinernema hermaphroditum TaxID=289476 RepID=A0AA39HBK0_9BILA|nr:hypothetical protein QR680_016256 [Steinernema hermaphroditum]